MKATPDLSFEVSKVANHLGLPWTSCPNMALQPLTTYLKLALSKTLGSFKCMVIMKEYHVNFLIDQFMVTMSSCLIFMTLRKNSAVSSASIRFGLYLPFRWGLTVSRYFNFRACFFPSPKTLDALESRSIS